MTSISKARKLASQHEVKCSEAKRSTTARDVLDRGLDDAPLSEAWED